MSSLRRFFLLLFMLVLVAGSAPAQEPPPSESDLLARADEALVRNDHASAVTALETILVKYPESQNEQVFLTLTRLCDTYGVDYAKAIWAYRLYGQRFPNGRSARRFQERLAYLESHRQDWEALRRFTEIRTLQDKRPATESVSLAEKLVGEYPDSAVAPDVYFYLASQQFKLEHYGPARSWADRYLATFPSNGKQSVDHVQGLSLYSKIARKQHDYDVAEQKLRAIESVDPARFPEFQKAIGDVRFERGAYRVFLVAVAYCALALLGVLAARPWRRKGFGVEPVRLIKLCAIALACTLGPLAYAHWHQEKMIPSTFWVLGVMGCASFLLLRLSSPVAAQIGRKAYLAMSFVFLCATVYTAFYITDSARMFLWPIEEIGRHG